MPNRSFSGRRLGVVVALAVAPFVAATAVSQALALRIDAASDLLASNSSPSIERLAAVRSEVRQVQFRLDAYVDARAAGRAADRGAIEESLAAVNEDTREYLLLPAFAGEHPYWSNVQRALVGYNRAVSRAITLADEGAVAKAQAAVATDVGHAAEQTITAALAGIEFNARNERTLALAIKTARRRAILASWLMTALAASFAIVLGLLARRLMRKQDELYAEQARFAARRIEELEVFAGRVAHDIMNPIAAATMAIGLARRTTSEERTRSYADRALGTLSRTRMLVDDLLEFTRAAAQPEPGARTELRPIVDDTVRDVAATAQSASISFQVEIPRCACACAQGVLTSVVANLVRNAVKFAGGGPEPRVVIRAIEGSTSIRFEVEDNGPGLATGLDEHDVFRPLVRGRGTGQPGIGLGLATVKRLVEAHGGRVGCSSRPGEGCTFWLELPRADLDPVEASVPAEPPGSVGGN